MVAGTLLCLLLVSNAVFALNMTEIKSSGQIRFATEGGFPPFNEFKSGKLSGFEVEIGNAIAAKLGMKITWQTLPFDSLLIGLGQSRYDVVIASHAITPERAKAVDFTSPHYCTGGTIFTGPQKGTPGPKSKSELSGKTVGVQVGTTYLTNLKKISGVKDIKTYPKDTDALQNLLAGRIDAWITDRFVGRQAIAAQNKNGAKLEAGDIVFEERVAMAVSKGNNDLKAALDKALTELIADGTYEKISTNFFGEDIRCK
jgi:polar amino acid transport system substrate-binding protein